MLSFFSVDIAAAVLAFKGAGKTLAAGKLVWKY